MRQIARKLISLNETKYEKYLKETNCQLVPTEIGNKLFIQDNPWLYWDLPLGCILYTCSLGCMKYKQGESVVVVEALSFLVVLKE
jgi:hypothetical protein